MKSLLTSQNHGMPLIMLSAYGLLCLYGLAILWSVTSGIIGPYEIIDPGVAKSVFWKQTIWIALGWGAVLAGMRIPVQLLDETAPMVYAAAIVGLLLVLAVAPEVAGSKRWFTLGPIRIQPAEPAKVALIIMLARVLSRFEASNRQLLPVISSLLLMLVCVALVLQEPDLGTSLVFVAIWLVMIFWFGLSWVFLLSVASPLLSGIFSFYSERIVSHPWPWGIYLLLLLLALWIAKFRLLESILLLLANVMTGIGISFFWGGLKPYQQERILTFFDPARDQFGTGYQAIQSKVAIGSGGLFGTQYLQGTQKGLAFLPERHTDFIFSVVGEELGFVGAMILIGLFLVIILGGIGIAARARKSFSSLLVIGIVGYYSFHVAVNISITIGLMPVTGLPLPIMSYGGSNLVVSSFLLGLMVNVGSRSFET